MSAFLYDKNKTIATYDYYGSLADPKRVNEVVLVGWSYINSIVYRFTVGMHSSHSTDGKMARRRQRRKKKQNGKQYRKEITTVILHTALCWRNQCYVILLGKE